MAAICDLQKGRLKITQISVVLPLSPLIGGAGHRVSYFGEQRCGHDGSLGHVVAAQSLERVLQEGEAGNSNAGETYPIYGPISVVENRGDAQVSEMHHEPLELWAVPSMHASTAMNIHVTVGLEAYFETRSGALTNAFRIKKSSSSPASPPFIAAPRVRTNSARDLPTR